MTTFIPKLSTQAGACLTMANWQEVGIEYVAFSLAALLVKPGLDVLKQYSSLHAYVGWEKKLVLNASTLIINKQGKCQIRSNFDGGCLKFDFSELISLMVQWAPDFLLLPKIFPVEQLSQLIPLLKGTRIFVHAAMPLSWENDKELGVYIDESVQDLKTVSLEFQPFQDRMKYLISAHDIKAYSILSTLDLHFIESDKPALDAMEGLVYTPNKNISIADSSQSMCFDKIDEFCKCPTCQQSLSRAYLSHLYSHTPLLCQRFLIQHNVFQTCHLP